MQYIKPYTRHWIDYLLSIPDYDSSLRGEAVWIGGCVFASLSLKKLLSCRYLYPNHAPAASIISNNTY